jgi:TIR domain
MRVFLSCPSRDFDIGKAIAGALRQLAMDVWFLDGVTPHFNAENPVRTIDEFRSAGIKMANVFAIIVTDHTGTSVGVAKELADAARYNIPILPLLIEGTQRLPQFLQLYQHITVNPASPESIRDIFTMISSFGNKVSSTKREDAIPVEKRIEHFIPRVFIAYSHKQQHIAQNLSTLLTKSQKPHFWDAKIKAGATWRQTIQQALDDSTHLIVIWTSDAGESDEVEREVSYALAERKVIVPLLSKEISKLPYHLHGLHYITLPDDLSQIEGELLKALSRRAQNEDIWQ